MPPFQGLPSPRPPNPRALALGCPIVPFQGKEENPHAEDVARLRNVDHPRQNCHTPARQVPPRGLTRRTWGVTLGALFDR